MRSINAFAEIFPMGFWRTVIDVGHNCANLSNVKPDLPVPQRRLTNLSDEQIEQAAQDEPLRYTGDQVRDNAAATYRGVVALLRRFAPINEISEEMHVNKRTVQAILRRESEFISADRKATAQRLKHGGFQAICSALHDSELAPPNQRAFIGALAFDKGLALETSGVVMDSFSPENVIQIDPQGPTPRDRVLALLK